MAHIHSKTPLANLVSHRLGELGITITGLVERMGFANLDKGLRRVNGYLDTGQEDSHLLQALPKVLGLEAAQVEAAAVATRQQIADAEKTEASVVTSKSDTLNHW